MPNDPFSAYTHLGGALAFAIAAFIMLRRANPHARRWSLAVFATTAILLLLSSALFHWLPSGSSGRAIAQRLDHAAIFALIAGTFTPIHAILFRGVLRWGVLSLIWTAAIAGLTLKIVFFNDVPEALGVSAYLALGWVGLFSMVLIFWRWGARYVSPMVLGGLAYTVGAMCEFTSQPTIITDVIKSHEVFHVAVLVGLGCHWMFVRRIASGKPPARVKRAQSPRTGAQTPHATESRGESPSNRERPAA